jgi:hypothetical protein
VRLDDTVLTSLGGPIARRPSSSACCVTYTCCPKLSAAGRGDVALLAPQHKEAIDQALQLGIELLDGWRFAVHAADSRSSPGSRPAPPCFVFFVLTSPSGRRSIVARQPSAHRDGET